MNVLVPFTKDIKFKGSIAEILSVSLEHDYTINTQEILGNFTISGDYKSHEVSVNKEHFEYVLPFSVNLSSCIDAESVDFEVNDFTYDVIDGDTLRVSIEYRVQATETKEEPLFRTIEETDFDKILEDTLEPETQEVKEEIKEPEVKEERELEDKKEVVLDTIKTQETEYITYIIHEMKETDTIESICTKYNISNTTLSDYNDLSNLFPSSKLIIPLENE